MSVIESKIEAQLVSCARKRGFQTHKLDQIPGNRHMPDQILVNKNRVCVYVEVKREDLEPRPAQLAKHAQLRNAGQHVQVLDRIEDIDTLLDMYE